MGNLILRPLRLVPQMESRTSPASGAWMLDGPPPVAKTLGPQGTAAFLAKGAGLISQLDQSILRRVADLSF